MMIRRTLPALSLSLALVGLGAVASTACTSDPQGSTSPEIGGTSANGGSQNSTKDSGSATGGKSATATKGSGSGQGGTKSSNGSSGRGGSEEGGATGSDDASDGGSTSTGSSKSSCVSGVNTGSTCDPEIDTAECVRSTRTCTCESSGKWACTTTSGGGGASGTGETTGTGGTSNSSTKSGLGGTSNSGTKTAGGTAGTGLGGNTSATTATTGSPGADYCPATEPCRISPLGDSITEGLGWTPPGASAAGGGYRVKLFGLANADGKNFTFVGTRSNGPSTVDGKPFPQKHEGTSGITIEDLQKNVIEKGSLSGAKPHIILLHIGTNNMYNSHPDTPAALLAKFLDKVIADCPDALLVVAKLIPLPMNTSGIDTLNAAIPKLVEERAAKGAHIVLVDQFTGFPTAQLGDQVHPNEQGYARMADVWYKAIEQYLH